MPWGLMTVGHAPEFIEVTHQEQLVISWHRVECVSDDLVKWLLLLLWVAHRRGADEGEVGVACQWDAHGHQPVVDPFWKGFKLGDENCADGEANIGLPGFIGCFNCHSRRKCSHHRPPLGPQFLRGVLYLDSSWATMAVIRSGLLLCMVSMSVLTFHAPNCMAGLHTFL